jgi:hypothetical protein
MGLFLWRSISWVSLQLLGADGKVLICFWFKELHWDKFEKRYVIGYGAIIDHFGNGNLYKKDDAQQQKFIENLLFVIKDYMPIFIVES